MAGKWLQEYSSAWGLCAKIRKTTDDEREQYIQATQEDLRNEYGIDDFDEFEIETHHLWRRVDVEPNDEGRCSMIEDYPVRPPIIVSARLVLNIRNVCPHVGR